MNWPEDYVGKVIEGHSLDVMRGMPDECIRTCITSPPYWGLRDYGIKAKAWGGDGGCEHEWGKGQICPTKIGRAGSTEYGKYPRLVNSMDRPSPSQFCRCGAWLGSLGLEPSPELYVQHLVEIFREVRRVLRKDGTLWLNIGDSYMAHGGGGEKRMIELGRPSENALSTSYQLSRKQRHPTIKGKEMVLIPFRLALALQADGWWIRSDIIWVKPNCMPSSVKDRPTTDYEHVFLLAKSRKYYYDVDAIREPCICVENRPSGMERQGEQYRAKVAGRKYTGIKEASGSSPSMEGHSGNSLNHPLGRNKRCVWTIPTQPFPGAHFAVFPEALVQPMVLAGSREDDIVLDPFAGAGTTCVVAKKEGRRWIGIDLSPEYCEMARKRIRDAQAQLKLPF